MSVVRISKKENPYLMMDKTPLQDPNISWKAKGLLAYLLSLPDDWKIYVNEIKNHAKDGRDGTRAAFNELMRNGYIVRNRVRGTEKGEQGRFKGWEYVVYETPQPHTANPKTENPKTANPKTENPPLLNNNNTDNNITNKEKDSFLEKNQNSTKDAKTPQTTPKDQLPEEKEKSCDKKEKEEEIVDEGMEVLKASTNLKTKIVNYLSSQPTILTLIKDKAKWRGDVGVELDKWCDYHCDNFKAKTKPTSFFCKTFPTWLSNALSRNKGKGKKAQSQLGAAKSSTYYANLDKSKIGF